MVEQTTDIAIDDAEESPKVGSADATLLVATMVVLEAEAGLAMLEASPVLLCPFDHTSIFYERNQTRVALSI